MEETITLAVKTIFKMKHPLIFVCCLLLSCLNLFPQAPQNPNAAQLQQDLNKLNVLGSVLYIAAHPDDENTALISYLANEELLDVAYLSLTRGDGGQNVIGPEIREELGVIRTQELLAARRLDGGKQFFSRANDFGFSKNPNETFNIWDREGVLADMVWVIRNFQPDVLITRFNTTPGITHGHHTASAILAEEAFVAAGDSTRFTGQLEFVNVWQPKKLFCNVYARMYGGEEAFINSPDYKKMLTLDVGQYNPLLGKSYTEMAAQSRSMHKCQAMGTMGRRGEKLDYLLPLMGSEENDFLFAGINTDWSRIEGGGVVGRLLEEATISFNTMNPSEVVPLLLDAHESLKELETDAYWKKTKLAELEKVIEHSLGLFLEAKASDFSTTSNDWVNLEVEAVNRAPINVKLKSVQYAFAEKDSTINTFLKENEKLLFSTKQKIPSNFSVSQPYWLTQEGTLGMFKVMDHRKIGQPENAPPLSVEFVIEIDEYELRLQKPVIYKSKDDVAGELYRPFSIAPPVTANIAEQVYVFAENESQQINVLVKAWKADATGRVTVTRPKGWTLKPDFQSFNIAEKGGEQLLTFELTPPNKQSKGKMMVMVEVEEGNILNHSFTEIKYDHIPPQLLFPERTSEVVKLDIKKVGERIAYIKGAGDVVPEALRQMGYQVDELTDADITLKTLQLYDAVVLGVRVFNKRERIQFHLPILWKYVEEGGTLVSQYNTSYSLLTDELGPYPLDISKRDRVTAEDAEVRFLAPNHPVLNTPNKITAADFEGWVQERGLYFPNEWDEHYTPILSANDVNEEPKNGGLLVAEHGKGYYVYTGYSFFRELPAGVPGAYRLLANLVSLRR